jgi:L-asparaginase
MRIHVITTGGTIDKVYFDATSEYEVGEPRVVEILRSSNVRLDFSVESVLRKDSLEITEADRELIRERIIASPIEKILVTHGTDTMVQSALMLYGIVGKTIVLTGAMQPARFRESDAVFNVGVAIGALQVLPSGVYIAMNGRIFDPRTASKNKELNCFEENGGI